MAERYWRLYLWIVLGLAGIELLSWVAWQNLAVMPLLTGLIALGALMIGLWRPAWLALMTMAELVIGGKGYLFFLNVHGQRISIRIVLFLVLSLVAAVQLFQQRRSNPTVWPKITPWLLGYLAWITFMAGVGIVRQYGATNVFLDVNGPWYLAIFFFWWLTLRTQPHWRNLALTTVLAGITIVGGMSWLMQLLFAHQPPNINDIYRWIRDSGVGEVTLIQAPVYRVFFQSQFYGVVLLSLTLAGFLWRRAPRWWMWPMIASALATYISLSRSFWLGLGAGLMVLLVLHLRQFGIRGLRHWLIVLPLATIVWLMVSLAMNWPYVFPSTGIGGTNLVSTRLHGAGSSQAASARVNQIQPLTTAIRHQPLWGYGFGKTLTYYSTDPRVRGWRTTAAFELGYLDLWLKYGLIGLGLLGILIFFIAHQLWRSSWRPLFYGGLIALVTIHFTTPYLNHPLGLGWLALTAVFAYDQSS